MSSSQIRRMMTNPKDMMQFQATGRLPQGIRPSGPLVDLLKQIGPRDRQAITGLKVDHRLGYAGSRTFESAELAFRWLHPADEVFGSFPANAFRIEIRGPLTIDDVIDCSERAPGGLVEHYPRLRRQVAIQSAAPVATVAKNDGDADITPGPDAACRIRP